jgi:hypothetical protein
LEEKSQEEVQLLKYKTEMAQVEERRSKLRSSRVCLFCFLFFFDFVYLIHLFIITEEGPTNGLEGEPPCWGEKEESPPQPSPFE